MTSNTRGKKAEVELKAWKNKLVENITKLEDNLDQLFQIAGIKARRILKSKDLEIDDSSVVVHNRPSDDKRKDHTSHETIIDEHIDEIRKATSKICSLITSVTEFPLPIPVDVLLSLASRLLSLRWDDYNKKHNGTMSRQYVYTKSILIHKQSLSLFRWISSVIGSNSTSLQFRINERMLSLLGWTRSSNLKTFSPTDYFSLRSEILSYITATLDTLASNISLESQELKQLIELEIIHDLTDLYDFDVKIPHKLIADGSQQTSLSNGFDLPSRQNSTEEFGRHQEIKDDYALAALRCLDRLFLTYSDFLEASLERELKTFIITTCLNMYRDFESEVVGLAVRRQLIKLVETLAARPSATSTTELAWHVFDLAYRMEVDSETRYIASRSMRIGLAHRPVIMSDRGTYSRLEQPMEDEQIEDEGREDQIEVDGDEREKLEGNNERGKEVAAVAVTAAITTASSASLEVEKSETAMANEKEAAVEVEFEVEKTTASEHVEIVSVNFKQQQQHQLQQKQQQQQMDEDGDEEADDPQVQSYLRLFVDKPSSQLNKEGQVISASNGSTPTAP